MNMPDVKTGKIFLLAAATAFICALTYAVAAADNEKGADREKIISELNKWFGAPEKGNFEKEAAIIKKLTSENLLTPIAKSADTNKTRLGFFYGGRTMYMHNSYVDGNFKKNNVDVAFYTGVSDHKGIYEVPEDRQGFKRLEDQLPYYGKITGTEIVNEMRRGNLDAGTIGEGSFVQGVADGAPIVAVAQLGYDGAGIAGKAFLLRSDIKISSPKDFKNRVFSNKESGPGEIVFLKEFFAEEDVDLNDVIIINHLPYNKVVQAFKEKKIDGGFFHLVRVKILTEENLAYVYRPMDWVDPELSHALLVFNADYLKKNRARVKDIVRVYMERAKKEGKFGLRKGKEDFKGMLNFPVFDEIPLVRTKIVNKMKGLMLKHNEIKNDIDMSKFIDNSIVEELNKEMSEKNKTGLKNAK